MHVINHLPTPDLFINLKYQVQYDNLLAWKGPKSSIFGSILATNIEINKRSPKMIYLHALGSYWNEYGTKNAHYKSLSKKHG